MGYPLDFATYSLEYSDGNRSNKFYNVSLLVAGNGMALIVRRWGKAGSPGELKTERFAIQKKAESEFDKIVRSKLAKGYATRTHNLKQIQSEADLRMAIGPAVWPRLPAPDIAHILPDMDTTGRPQQLNPPRFNEDGKFIGDPPPRVFSQTEIKQARAAEKAVEQEEAIKTYAANPRFGMF